MSARLKVLELIEQGKLSPEEGARLLEAMAPPASPRFPMPPNPPTAPLPTSSAGGWGRWPGGTQSAEAASRHSRQAARRLHLSDLHESLRDLSSEIRDAVRGGMSVVLGEDEPEGFAGFDEVDSDVLALPEGPLPRLNARCAGGDVKIVRGEGREIRIRHQGYLRVFTRALGTQTGEVVIRGREGELVIESPSGLPSLDIRSDGGDVNADIDVDQLVLAAAGGDVRFSGTAGTASVSAAGGDVHLDRLRLVAGDSRVKAAGGDLRVVLATDSNVTVTAKTVGGSVNLPDGGKVRTKQFGPVAKGQFVLGNGAASLKLSSAGGDLTVEVGS